MAVRIFAGMRRLRAFVTDAVRRRGGNVQPLTDTRFRVDPPGASSVVFTVDRDEAMADEHRELLGLEHPLVAELLAEARGLAASQRAVFAADGRGAQVDAVWEVRIQGPDGGASSRLCQVRMNGYGGAVCLPYSAEVLAGLRQVQQVQADEAIPERDRRRLVTEVMPAAIRAYLAQSGTLARGSTYSARLLGWVERTMKA